MKQPRCRTSVAFDTDFPNCSIQLSLMRVILTCGIDVALHLLYVDVDVDVDADVDVDVDVWMWMWMWMWMRMWMWM